MVSTEIVDWESLRGKQGSQEDPKGFPHPQRLGRERMSPRRRTLLRGEIKEATIVSYFHCG